MGIDGERFKYVADVLVEEAGITPMLHRLAVAPIVEDGAIRGVITESKSGREAILAKRVVDATGDADVAARAGAPVRKTPREEMLAASVMFSMTGVNKRRFLDAVKADPQTYRDWAGNAEWDIETTGKEDELFSPFLRKPFKQAVEAGLIPPDLITLAGTWGTVTDQGDLTYLNLVHLTEVDGTSADDLTRGEIEGRQQAMHAIKALRDVHARLRGREAAQLRHDDRHPRHAQDRGALRPDRRRRPRAGPLRRLDRHLPGVHRRLRAPDPADDRPLLPGAVPVARAAGASTTSSSAGR